MSKRRSKVAPNVSIQTFTHQALHAPRPPPRAKRQAETQQLTADDRRRRTQRLELEASPVLKRRRLSDATLGASGGPEPDDFPMAEGGTVIQLEAPTWKRRRYIPTDEPLRDWIGFADEYVEEMVRLRGRGDAADRPCPTCPPGQRSSPLYRCNGCTSCSMYCASCIVKSHSTRPFCPIEEWRDGSFHRTTLSALGLEVQLGHPEGEACPNATLVHKDFYVLDVTGIHHCTIRQCGCLGAPSLRQQLLRHRLFPSTPNAPKTACTFALLEHFHNLTFHGKVTMYDYYKALEHLTDKLGISGLKDRHHLFARCIREWRYLHMLMQGGRGNDCTRPASDVREGELAIRCPACPVPGENLPEGWDKVPRDKQYLYTLTIAMDACFRLKRRQVSSIEKDPRLIDGGAYMVKRAGFDEWMRDVGSQEETVSSCSGLSALEHANTKYAKGYAETGKGIGVCARHEFVQPNGVVPLQVGERYANMDYALGSLLRHHSRRLLVVLSYDIACQFFKNLVDRIKRLPPLIRFSAVARTMRFVVPKLHILGHKMACQLLFNIAYLLGGARTDGEGVERPWAHLGPLGASLRQMGPGSAADTLEDHLNYWNWLKLIALGQFLLRKLLEALKEEAIQRAEFEAFSREQVSNVPRWEAAVLAFEKDNSAPNPFELPKPGATEADVQLELAQEDAREAARGAETAHELSPADFIVALLEVEEDQRALRFNIAQNSYATSKQQTPLSRQRVKVAKTAAKVKAAQRVYTPAAFARVEAWISDASNADAFIEDRPLIPPSALPAVERSSCIGNVAGVEERLRHAQCRAALAEIRDLLMTKARDLRFKNNHSRHQGATTRARNLLHGTDGKIARQADKYITARAALVSLNDGDEDKVPWRALDTGRDLRCMEEGDAPLARTHASNDVAAETNAAATSHIQRLRNATGEGRHTVSWIWYGASTTDPDAVGTELYEGIRVEWSKAFARLRWWQEQIPLLREEMRRTLTSLERRAERWSTRAEQETREGAVGEGAKAYAAGQQRAYLELAQHFRAMWQAAPESAQIDLAQAIQLEAELAEDAPIDDDEFPSPDPNVDDEDSDSDDDNDAGDV